MLRSGQSRRRALSGKVYIGLLDGRLVALNAQTGLPEWAVQTTPPGADYTITGAPRVVKGKVVIGQGGAEYGVRGFLAGYERTPASSHGSSTSFPAIRRSRLKTRRWRARRRPGTGSGGSPAVAARRGTASPTTPN